MRNFLQTRAFFFLSRVRVFPRVWKSLNFSQLKEDPAKNNEPANCPRHTDALNVKYDWRFVITLLNCVN